jgi:hypothetical protein
VPGWCRRRRNATPAPRWRSGRHAPLSTLNTVRREGAVDNRIGHA